MREPMPVQIRGLLHAGEPLSRHTSWRVGGPADRYFEPADRADLVAFVRALPANEPVLWLGLGSNLLVRDGGFRGTVIALHGALDELTRDEAGQVYAEAGVHCARLAKFAERQQLAGLGYMAGIPGTVGGALAMNAGAWGGETWPTVAEVDVLMRDGSIVSLTPSAFEIGYRTVVPPADFLGFLAARFKVTADVDGRYAAATRDSLAQRKATPAGRQAECRQHFPQSARRSRCTADRKLRPEKPSHWRRARLAAARQFHPDRGGRLRRRRRSPDRARPHHREAENRHRAAFRSSRRRGERRCVSAPAIPRTSARWPC